MTTTLRKALDVGVKRYLDGKALEEKSDGCYIMPRGSNVASDFYNSPESRRLRQEILGFR